MLIALLRRFRSCTDEEDIIILKKPFILNVSWKKIRKN